VITDLGIASIGVSIPPDRLDNFARMVELNTDAGFLDEKIGTRAVSRMESGTPVSAYAAEACRKALQTANIAADQIECVVLCTQNPEGHGIPHTSAIVHARLGLPETCACFDISLGCSGYVYGLSVILSFMRANSMKCGLLVTADPYSRIIDPMDRNTVLLFGDAATATLICPPEQGASLFTSNFEFATRGSGGAAIANSSGILEMNGRAVFEFVITDVPAQVRQLLAHAGKSTDDVDFFLFHQGSRFIVEQLARSMKLPPEKVPLALNGTGNTVSSSIPISLEGYLSRSKGSVFLLSGFGVGLSWASCLLHRI